jgi:hypothetical protein
MYRVRSERYTVDLVSEIARVHDPTLQIVSFRLRVRPVCVRRGLSDGSLSSWSGPRAYGEVPALALLEGTWPVRPVCVRRGLEDIHMRYMGVQPVRVRTERSVESALARATVRSGPCTCGEVGCVFRQAGKTWVRSVCVYGEVWFLSSGSPGV